MKKIITITATAIMGVAGLTFTASAHEPRRGVQYYERRRPRAQIEHTHSELHGIRSNCTSAPTAITSDVNKNRQTSHESFFR